MEPCDDESTKSDIAVSDEQPRPPPAIPPRPSTSLPSTDVNSRIGQNGDTSLHLAIRPRYDYYGRLIDPSIDRIKFLLNELNADPNVTNFCGETPLFTLAKINGKLNEDVLKMLIEKGANLEMCNADGESVLHVYHNSDHLLNLFKADVNLKTPTWLYCQTPLMVAAKKGSLDYCESLILKGADVNCRDLQGYTALHHAVLSGEYDCANFLVRNGADTNAKSDCGRDPYDLGVYRRYSDPFTFGAEPARRKAEIHEIAGAMVMMRDQNRDAGLKHWDEVTEIYSKMDQKLKRTSFPSLTFLDNYYFLKENPDTSKDVIHQKSMYSIERLSKGISKFWILIPFSSSRDDSTSHESSRDYLYHVFKNLGFLSQYLERIPFFASFEEADFESLLQLVKFFDSWLEELVKAKSKNELAMFDRISYVHSVAELVTACFKRRIYETENSKLPNCTFLELYVETCHVLTAIRVRFKYDISEQAFNENEGLLRNLIDLDLRDRDDNCLTHLILKEKKFDELLLFGACSVIETIFYG